MSPLLLLILVTALIRIVMGWALGLGVDETYMVAASRHLALSYYDHPPISWWLAHAAMSLTGSDAPVVVRLPFILLFALTTWLMARLTTELFDARAGLWAAILLNLSPVYAVTAGGWVLPDGPLDCAMLGFALFTARAVGVVPSRSAWLNWLGAGLCAGLAMLSKYNAALVLIGLPAFLLTTRHGRAWLMRPEPWVAGAIALLIFSPVIIWNVEHGWASFAFQGSRAGGLRFQPLAPFGVWAGEALFVLPWIWVPLILLWLRALRRGPTEPKSWLLALLAATPILLFAIVAVWSSRHILFHWSTPGTLMLFPLLGAEVARRVAAGAPAIRKAALGTAALLLALLILAGTEMRLNWVASLFGPGILAHSGDVAGALNWTTLKPELEARGLLSTPGLVIGVTRWSDAGKVDYELGGTVPVVILAADAREYGILAPLSRFAGRPMLVLVPRSDPAAIAARLSSLFRQLTILPSLTIPFGAFPLVTVSVLRGEVFSGSLTGHPP